MDSPLLPAIHLINPTRNLRSTRPSTPPSPSPVSPTRRTRHCPSRDCFLTVSPEASHWLTLSFDTFDPRDLDEYGYLPPPRACSPQVEARRVKRASELRTRAKARLMPAQTRQSRLRTPVMRRESTPLTPRGGEDEDTDEEMDVTPTSTVVWSPSPTPQVHRRFTTPTP